MEEENKAIMSWGWSLGRCLASADQNRSIACYIYKTIAEIILLNLTEADSE